MWRRENTAIWLKQPDFWRWVPFWVWLDTRLSACKCESWALPNYSKTATHENMQAHTLTIADILLHSRWRISAAFNSFRLPFLLPSPPSLSPPKLVPVLEICSFSMVCWCCFKVILKLSISFSLSFSVIWASCNNCLRKLYTTVKWGTHNTHAHVHCTHRLTHFLFCYSVSLTHFFLPVSDSVSDLL